jgi:hypothetical protein
MVDVVNRLTIFLNGWKSMGKKFFLAAVLLVVFAQAGFAQKSNNSVEILTNYKLEMVETQIWIIKNDDTRLKDNGLDVVLNLSETNPTFFVLVYNTIKDHLRDKQTQCYVWTNSPKNGSIRQIQIKSK